MKLSFIVSSYNRPTYLGTCLASLLAQSVRMDLKDLEFIVTCNNRDVGMMEDNKRVAQAFGAHFCWTDTPDCYYAAEVVFGEVTGEWVGFPSDDSYYVPLFLENMLKAGEEFDFVYSDMLYTSKWTIPPWSYSVMDVSPVRQHIDKTCFLLKRELFTGFPGKKNGAPCEADGELAEELVSRGVRHGKAEGGALVVHN